MPKTPCDGCVYWRLIQGRSRGSGVSTWKKGAPILSAEELKKLEEIL